MSVTTAGAKEQAIAGDAERVRERRPAVTA